MIETRGLCKSFRSTVALQPLDLSIGPGELFGFLGPNGAGKTTTIRLLATLLEPSGGDAFIADHSVRTRPREVRRLLGYLPDDFGVYDDLLVSEYLEFFAAAYGIRGKQRTQVVNDVLELTDLGGMRDRMVETLSRGMRQRLGLARVLVHDPRVLLLDEPASGLDPRARVELREILRELRAMGKTILVSSHILADLAEMCTSVGILEGGRLLAAGPVEQVLRGFAPRPTVLISIASPEPGALERAAEALRSADWVEEVAVLAEISGGGRGLRCTLRNGNDGADRIARFLVERSFGLSHLEVERGRLEEAFLRATEGQRS